GMRAQTLYDVASSPDDLQVRLVLGCGGVGVRLEPAPGAESRGLEPPGENPRPVAVLPPRVVPALPDDHEASPRLDRHRGRHLRPGGVRVHLELAAHPSAGGIEALPEHAATAAILVGGVVVVRTALPADDESA